MVSYVLRRLLIMIPTLFGITFLVFMLIAMSPGGIGAALRQAGGQMEASQRFLQEAYLEDRFGLKDPAPVQYLRWIERISPIKFGARDQRDPAGEVIRAPKPVPLPPLAGSWYPGEPIEGGALEPADLPDDPGARNEAYRSAANAYARARGALIARRVDLEQALREYAEAAGLPDAVERDADLRLEVFRRAGPDRSLEAYDEVASAGAEAMEAYERAVEARRELAAVFRARPYPEVGFWLIPGLVSVGPPDMGMSFSRNRPVLDLMLEALPVTLLINTVAFPIIYLIAVPSGMLAAARRGSWIDVLSGAAFVALWSIPVVWAGVLAVGYLASDKYLGAFPVAGLHDPDSGTFRFLPWFDEGGGFRRGYALDVVWHMCLPVACLVYTGFAILSKQTRAAMLEQFNADYVRTAKAKGVAPKDVVFRHVFRNSLLPLITLFATLFPALLSGSVVVERIFSVPGMGSLTLEAINLRDRELLLANVLMIGTVNVFALLLADLLYALADPRITYD